MYDYRELGRACWLHFVGHYSETKAAQQAYDENRRAKIVFVPAVAAAAVHDKILENEMPRLFSSCRRVLNRLKRRYFLVLFTSGKKRLQIKVIRHHRFENYFEMIFVRKVKNVSAFRQLKARTINAFSLDVGHRPGRLVMVGDRMSQDIAPASKAGFETIWIPGPYFPGNSNSEKPTCQIKKLRQLPRILLTKDRRNIASISRRNIARRSKGD
jgi:FMN phosphatase YigB (HAD superfamily)